MSTTEMSDANSSRAEDESGDESVQEVVNVASQKKTAARSQVFEHFTHVEDRTWSCDLSRNRTPSRKVLVARNKHGSTITFWRHLKKFHIKVHNDLKGISNPSPMDMLKKNPSSSHNPLLTGITLEKTKEELARVICTCDLPWCIAENPNFIRWSTYCAQVEMKLPGVRCLRETFKDMYEREKQVMVQKLSSVSGVSLTVDAWKSDNDLDLLGITIHWIDKDWKLCEKVLSLHELTDGHGGDKMAEVVVGVINEFNIASKIIAITTDNASCNGKMIRHIVDQLREVNPRFDIGRHILCLCHIINLIVQAALIRLQVSSPIDFIMSEASISDSQMDDILGEPSQAISFVGSAVSRVRNVVNLIRTCKGATRKYRDKCVQVGAANCNNLPIDCRTRWNSTFNMLVSAIEKREVLSNSSILDSHNMRDLIVTNDEWDVLTEFAELLRPFAAATDMASSSKSLTVTEVLGGLQILHLHLMNAKDLYSLCSASSIGVPSSLSGVNLAREQRISLLQACEAMLQKMKKYIDKLKSNNVVAVAALLHPSTKLQSIDASFHPEVSTFIRKLLDDSTPSRTEPLANEPQTPTTQPRGSQNIFTAGLLLLRSAAKQTPTQPSIDELADYLRSPYCTSDDALAWWKVIGENSFPKLAKIAKDFLSISPSSAPSERLFSAGRSVVTYKRNRLKAETINMLLTMKSWLRIDEKQSIELLPEYCQPLDLTFPEDEDA